MVLQRIRRRRPPAVVYVFAVEADSEERVAGFLGERRADAVARGYAVTAEVVDRLDRADRRSGTAAELDRVFAQPGPRPAIFVGNLPAAPSLRTAAARLLRDWLRRGATLECAPAESKVLAELLAMIDDTDGPTADYGPPPAAAGGRRGFGLPGLASQDAPGRRFGYGAPPTGPARQAPPLGAEEPDEPDEPDAAPPQGGRRLAEVERITDSDRLVSRRMELRLDYHVGQAAGHAVGNSGYTRDSVGHYGPPSYVPMEDRRTPLPHDGLFVRRNNSFGTKSTVGIADLIEQGVLIDQTQIRFDDYVASRGDQIPGPLPGESVTVHQGFVAAPEDFKVHAATTHFLEIVLRAGDAPAGDDRPRPVLPVNFVFVVDTSGSMAGEKLDTVKTAIRELYEQLRDVDIIGVVTFDTEVRTRLRATPKSELSLEKITGVVADLVGAGGTDINLGLQYGIDEISRHSAGRADIVNCLYLFSDGDPTSGERNWIRIRSNVAAKIRGDLTLSCFGFGSNARMRELEALAGLAGGHSTFVTNPEEVRLNLAEDLTRREHLAAMNIQLRIDIDPDVTVWHLFGHDLVTTPAARAAVEGEARAVRRLARDEFGTESLPDLIAEEKGIRIFAPDLAFGETYWIVFELQAPSDDGAPNFGTATVQYVDTVARANSRRELALAGIGSIPAETVFAHAVGLWTSEITFYALDDLYARDHQAATARLSQHINRLVQAHVKAPRKEFVDDQVTFRKLISLSSNLGKMVTWDDRPDRNFQFVAHSMNEFGIARAGFRRTDWSRP